MFSGPANDLIKPQWLAIIRYLKVSGDQPIGALTAGLESRYMTIKQQCDELTERGYLKRLRKPRSEVGRPEIFYSLANKADVLFSSVEKDISSKLLREVSALFGERAPERILFQVFENFGRQWTMKIDASLSLIERVEALVKIRNKEGLFATCLVNKEQEAIVFRVFHNPYTLLFEEYQSVAKMEQNAMETALRVAMRLEVKRTSNGRLEYVDYFINMGQ